MTQPEAQDPSSTDALLLPEPDRRRKRLIAVALVGSFLVSASVLFFVLTPAAGASGGCGGG